MLHAFDQIDEGGTDIAHHYLLIQETLDIVFMVRIKFLLEILLVATLNRDRIVNRSFLLHLFFAFL